MYAVGSSVAWIKYLKVILSSFFLLLKSFYQQILSALLSKMSRLQILLLACSLRVQTTVILTRIISIAALQLVF